MVSFALLVSNNDLVSFHEVVYSLEKDKWMTGMIKEMKSLHHNRTWELVQLPQDKKAIWCKWVYRRKPLVLEKEGEIFKARLVSKGVF